MPNGILLLLSLHCDGRGEKKEREGSLLSSLNHSSRMFKGFSWTIDHLYASLIFLVNRWRLQRLGGKNNIIESALRTQKIFSLQHAPKEEGGFQSDSRTSLPFPPSRRTGFIARCLQMHCISIVQSSYNAPAKSTCHTKSYNVRNAPNNEDLLYHALTKVFFLHHTMATMYFVRAL